MSQSECRFFAIVSLSACMLAVISPPIRAQEHASSPEAGRISDSVRVQAYPEVIYGHGIMPDYDRGYMIQHDIEPNNSAYQTMVAMYDASGKRVLEARIWPKGAGSVHIRRTAATADGAILAGGAAIMQDGSISGFIVKTDLAGNTIQTSLTGDFKPEQICEAPDGTVWSLGRALRPDGLPVAETDVVRHYSFEKGLLHSFLPEETVRAVQRSDRPWFNAFGSFLRCGKEKVSIYLEFTDEYAEVSNSSFELTRWKLDRSVLQQRKANGLGVTDDGRVYVSLSPHCAYMGMSGPELVGLYQVKTEPGNPVARLLSVVGTVSNIEVREGERLPPGTLIWLWGADGNQLVVLRAEEHYASWVSVLDTPSTD